jgi:uncharacterized protein (UPF0332 family)
MGRVDDLLQKGKLKKAIVSKEMYEKEFNIAVKDLESAKKSFHDENYKWATIQAYYAVFHAARALLFKSGYREESHFALKVAFKELFIDTHELPASVYNTLERGMDLREMADYKETYSKTGAEALLKGVDESVKEITLHI